MIKSKREKSEKKKHLFPSKWLRDLGCCYLGTSCHQQHGQREKAAEWLELCQSHGPRGLPRGSWSSGCRDATPPSRECHAGRVAGAGGQPPPPPALPLCPSPCPCHFDPCCLFCPFVLCVLGVVVGSRGVYGRSGFASFFKSSAPSATRPETQPLLPASRRPSPPGRDTYGTSSLSSSSNSGSCKGSDSSPTPR